MGVTLVRRGKTFRGQTPESVVRTIHGRTAKVVYSPDPRDPYQVKAVLVSGGRTHLLAAYVLYEDPTP